MSLANDLENLEQLRNRGALSETEYSQATGDCGGHRFAGVRADVDSGAIGARGSGPAAVVEPLTTPSGKKVPQTASQAGFAHAVRPVSRTGCLSGACVLQPCLVYLTNTNFS